MRPNLYYEASIKTLCKISILTTGGTIEKDYIEDEGALENRNPLLHRLIGKLRLPYTDLEITPLLAKDSLYMTDDDRDFILKVIQEKLKLKTPILVLHGTDTMVKTLNHCADHLSDLEIPVVFTGAMRPIGYEDSDAQQNFVEALTWAQFGTPGLHLAFHGRIYRPYEVVKNKSLRTFEVPTKKMS